MQRLTLFSHTDNHLSMSHSISRKYCNPCRPQFFLFMIKTAAFFFDFGVNMSQASSDSHTHTRFYPLLCLLGHFHSLQKLPMVHLPLRRQRLSFSFFLTRFSDHNSAETSTNTEGQLEHVMKCLIHNANMPA